MSPAKVHFNDIEYHKYPYLRDYLASIVLTKVPAVYYWVHYPYFEGNRITHSKLIELLLNYTEKDLGHSENFHGNFKFEGQIRERIYPQNGELFGLSKRKGETLSSYLEDETNRQSFGHLFKTLCFSRPFYIGKANDLKKRLHQHFEEQNSNILSDLRSKNINTNDVWIGYIPVETHNNEPINEIIEEIISRRVKPTLTQKPN